MDQPRDETGAGDATLGPVDGPADGSAPEGAAPNPPAMEPAAPTGDSTPRGATDQQEASAVENRTDADTLKLPAPAGGVDASQQQAAVAESDTQALAVPTAGADASTQHDGGTDADTLKVPTVPGAAAEATPPGGAVESRASEPETVKLPSAAGVASGHPAHAVSGRHTPLLTSIEVTAPTTSALPRPATAPPAVPRGRTRPVRLIVTICAALALVCTLTGVWGAIQLAPPGGPPRSVDFQVAHGDTSTSVATRLERLGLLRSVQAFELDASLRGLDGHLAPGIYFLSASMGTNTLVSKLASGQPDAQQVTIPPGLRATQYPAYLVPLLPRFESAAFLRIVQTGTLPDGTALTSRYWYVPPRAPNAAYALEGYLAPGTYLIPATADAAQVVQLLVAGLGEQLCPGPNAAHRDAYLASAAACMQHAASVGSGASQQSIFAALEARFSTSDPRTALYGGLTLASLVARAAPGAQDAAGITSVYLNRYTAWQTNGSDPAGDAVQQLDAPASAQYGRDTDSPPAGGAWWAPLAAQPASVDPASPYNSSAPGHAGLIPGPIAASSWRDLAAVATASSPNYYFATACGDAFFATSAAEDLGVSVKVRYITASGCPASQVLYPATDPATALGRGTSPDLRVPTGPLAAPPAISAAYAYLMNAQTGQVLLSQDAQSEHPMASTTKLMTALVAVTYGQLDQPITVGQDINSLAGTGASLAGLQPGETLTLRELLYALLLPSGDDAGIVIADGIAGSQAGFVWLMNDQARLLGLAHTHYANPHGLDQAGHYTSAADLAVLAAADLQNSSLAGVVGTAQITVSATATHPQFVWTNTNELLLTPAYPGAIGVKTGYTGGAGYCLVFAARGPSGVLVGVLMDDATYEGRFTDARALLDWGFATGARLR